MNIYISHSRKFDFKNDLYAPIKASELASKNHFILPHDKTEELFNTKELFHSKGCELVIAEVSYPSTGQGIELGWANAMEIPIVCVYKDKAEFSKSLHEVSKRFLMYTSKENMIVDITGTLHNFE
ncbi:hypothetical protein BH09PAT1_BH09PAT1_6380 [soil metagenome]